MNRERVVVVDDDPVVRALLSDLLTVAGYDARAAATGGVALDLIASERPELVLLDVAMPDMDGIQTLDAIRARHPDVPVVMVTAFADVVTASRALAHGAVDYVTKPFDLAYVEQVVAAHVCNRLAGGATTTGSGARRRHRDTRPD